LLPWRTIAGNVRYGMELQKRFDEATMRERTDYFIKLVGLTGFERHFQSELLKIWSKAKKTVVFITHQINEAIYLADRVVVMSARPGRVKDVFDVPFDRPRSLSLKRDPRFLALEDSVWKLIEEESDKLGMVAAP